MEAYQIDLSNNIIRVEVSENTVLSLEMIIKIIDEIRGPIENWTLNDLWDIRNCNIPENVDYNAMMKIVTKLKRNMPKHGSHTKTAIVAGHGSAHIRATLFQSLISTLPYELAVFRENSDAMDWLLCGN